MEAWPLRFHGKLSAKRKDRHSNQMGLTAEERNKSLFCDRLVLETIDITNKDRVRDHVQKEYLSSKSERFEFLKCLSNPRLGKHIRIVYRRKN